MSFILFERKSTSFFPSGEFEIYVTLTELQACERMTFYRILEEYQFIPESNIYLYRDFISLSKIYGSTEDFIL